MGVFISQSPLNGIVIQETQSIGNITGSYVLLIIELIRKLNIFQLLIRTAGSVCYEISIITCRFSQNIFGTIFQYLFIPRSNRRDVIKLKGKLLVVACVFILGPAGDQFKVLAEETVDKVVGPVVPTIQSKDAEFLLWPLESSCIIKIDINVIGKVVHIHLPQQTVDQDLVHIGFRQEIVLFVFEVKQAITHRS